MSKFKVGDKVSTHYGKGIIIGIAKTGMDKYLVELVEIKGFFGHKGEGIELLEGKRGKKNNCRWFAENMLELVQPKQFTKLLNYIGLAHLINSGRQPKYVNLILNICDKEKVKYTWDEYSLCYMIDDKRDEDENYNLYLRDCLLDYQNFERCIEVFEEPARKMTVADIQKELGYKVEIVE